MGTLLNLGHIASDIDMISFNVWLNVDVLDIGRDTVFYNVHGEPSTDRTTLLPEVGLQPIFMVITLDEVEMSFVNMDTSILFNLAKRAAYSINGTVMKVLSHGLSFSVSMNLTDQKIRYLMIGGLVIDRCDLP